MRYSENNYFNNTSVLFEMIDSPNKTPDYISDSGSKYWYTENGVFRLSNHWYEVGTCYWSIIDSNFNFISTENEICGFAEWENFDKSTCLYDLNNGMYYTCLEGQKIYININNGVRKYITGNGVLKAIPIYLPSINLITPLKMNNIPFKELDNVYHLFKGWGIIVERDGIGLDVIFNNSLEKIKIGSNDYKLLSFSEYDLKNGGFSVKSI